MHSITHGESTIRYMVVRSARRKKTLTITIDSDDNVRVLVPLRAPSIEIEAMVRERADWILAKLAEERPRPRQFLTGEKLHYLGLEYPLVVQLTADPRPVRVLRWRPLQDYLPCIASGRRPARRHQADAPGLV